MMRQIQPTEKQITGEWEEVEAEAFEDDYVREDV